MQKNDMLELDITGVNSEGEGIARVGQDGLVVFVAGALPGERVKASVARVSRHFASAATVDVLRPSEIRREPICKSYTRCGGCSLQHASYVAQTAIKSKILTDALRRVAGIELDKIECVPSPSEWHYRNKTALPVRSVGRGKNWLCGYFEKKSHRIAPFRDCPVLMPALQAMLPSMLHELKDAHFSGWDERSLSGDIRFAAARTGGSEDAPDSEVIATAVMSRGLAKQEEWRLRGAFERVSRADTALVGASYNINPDKGNFIWGPAFKDMIGRKTVEQRLDPFSFETDISSFFQVNREQARAMFTHVGKIAGSVGAVNVLELYAGVGSLTAFVAKNAEHVTAVEEWRPAARQMQSNLDWNGISNVEAVESSSEGFMDGAANTPRASYDTVVLDPPRTGAAENVIAGISRIAPKNIIYISCNPATLARDIARLAPAGYAIQEIKAYDMFPQTPHVEAVCLLSRGL